MADLRGISWDHPRGVGGLRGAATQWEAQGKGRVHWETRSLQGFADQPLEKLVGSYDLLVIDHPHIPKASEQGLIARLDQPGREAELSGLAALSVGQSHRSYLHRGHQWGLAIDVAAQVAVYRQDLLQAPPRTWPEVLELARSGRVLWALKPVDAICSFLTLAANAVVPIAQDQFVARELGLEILAFMHELASFIEPACLLENPIQTAERLSTGDRWLYAPLGFGYVNYSRDGFRPKRLTYTDIPGGPRGVAGSCLGGAGIAVSATSPNLDLAIEHAFWLARPDVQRGIYYDTGGQPGSAAAWVDDRLNRDSNDFFRGTRATLEGAWLRPRMAGWLEVQDAVGALVNQALRGEITDEACLAGANAVFDRSREGTSHSRRGKQRPVASRARGS